jgi:menaquinol-cytochrome c reductase iron-sulfur subunit
LTRTPPDVEGSAPVEPHGPEQSPHVPPPSLWPVGFAVGVAVLLTGLVVGWWIVLLGAILAVSFGFLWIRDLGSEARIAPEPEVLEGHGAAPAVAGAGAALPVMSDEEIERFPRSKFLEASTIGVGAIIGGLVTVPALGFAVLPAFTGEEDHNVDVGAIDDFPEGEWRIVTFLQNPDEGEVSRRTTFVRYNGQLEGQPSFTIIANNCAHLGCPVQPSGPVDDEGAQEEEIEGQTVTRIPTQPAAFACPCHGGAYDLEGNRTAGPPVRALDRFNFAIRDGRLVLTSRYSVGTVAGEGAEATITAYGYTPPGVHVDGIEQLLYPIEAPK